MLEPGQVVYLRNDLQDDMHYGDVHLPATANRRSFRYSSEFDVLKGHPLIILRKHEQRGSYSVTAKDFYLANRKYYGHPLTYYQMVEEMFVVVPYQQKKVEVDDI